MLQAFSFPDMSWRRAVGPFATLAAVVGIALVDRHVTPLQAPGSILVWAIVLSAYFGGLASGLLSTAISLVFATVFLSEPGQLLHFAPEHATCLLILALTAPAIAATVGLLHAREARALRTERDAREIIEAANRELLVVRGALDEIADGIVLLDTELRAVFINRAFRRLWRLPDDKADSKPAFIALIYHGRDTQAYAVPREELNEFVAERMAMVRRGDETPLDLRLADGEVIRFKCKVLPGGGRMLSYASVTDLVRQADELHALASTDSLTGVSNRRQFFTLAEAEWSRHGRYDRPLSMLMIDIDNFKSVNDRFGHAVGDKVIQRLAEVCGAAKRDPDILARVGGEEFAMLLPETSAGDAAALAERLRGLIAMEARWNQPLPAVTLSIGVAQARPGVDGIPELMRLADNALYEAKRLGRDRVVLAAPDRKDRRVA